jgi:hypothetical protein
VKDRAGGGVDGVKNRSEKCEGSRRRGDQRVKEPKWEMGRTGGVGIDSCLKRKVFLKNQKHQPNIVEITHPCIMHGAHTSKQCIPLFLHPPRSKQTMTRRMDDQMDGRMDDKTDG